MKAGRFGLCPPEASCGTESQLSAMGSLHEGSDECSKDSGKTKKGQSQQRVTNWPGPYWEWMHKCTCQTLAANAYRTLSDEEQQRASISPETGWGIPPSLATGIQWATQIQMSSRKYSRKEITGGDWDFYSIKYLSPKGKKINRQI